LLTATVIKIEDCINFKKTSCGNDSIVIGVIFFKKKHLYLTLKIQTNLHGKFRLP